VKSNKKATAILLSITGSQAAVLPLQAMAAGVEGVTVQKMHYQESDDRIKVDYTQYAIAKDFGTDVSWVASASVDAISGATPAVDAKTGASQSTGGDGYLLNEGLATADGYTSHFMEMEDERKAINTALTWRTQNRHEWSAGVSHSEEDDYESRGFSIEHVHNLHPSRNRTLSIGYSRLDNEALFYRDNSVRDAVYSTLEVGLTEILTPESLVKFSGFTMYESGELSNPYKRIIRQVNEANSGETPVFRYYLSPDSRPAKRQVAGLDVKGVKRVYYDDYAITLHAQYRMYSDSWGVVSHTVEGKSYFGLPQQDWGQWYVGMRYMTQSAANFYYAPVDVFDAGGFGSNDERLSNFTDSTISVGWERTFAQHWQASVRTSQQTQSNGLDMSWTWLGMNYVF
jgi:hypothetical protein